MRIGTHAIVDGVEYRAGFGPQSTNIGLFVPGDQPQPDGFVWSSDLGGGGRWVKLVPRSTAQRLFSVATWALYKDKFPVNLYSVEPDGKAKVCYYLYIIPRHFGPKPRDENGDLIIPEDFFMVGNREYWGGTVDIADLTEIYEEVAEHPLEPEPRPQW